MWSSLVGRGHAAGRAGASRSSETRLMAQVLAGLFCAGASLALLTILLPHSARANVGGLLVVVGTAYAVGGLLLWRARSLPASVLQATLAWGSTLITAVAYFSGETPSPLVFFYLWVFLYSAYFLNRDRDGAPGRLRRDRLLRAAAGSASGERRSCMVGCRYGRAAGGGVADRGDAGS